MVEIPNKIGVGARRLMDLAEILKGLAEAAEQIGDLGDLETDAKDDLVAAINELEGRVEALEGEGE